MLLFFSLFFSGCLYRVHKLTSHFFAPSSQILPASRQARQICHFFSKDTSPLLGGCKRPGFPIQMLFTSFLRISLVIYFMFFCMQDAVPARPKQDCISVDKYNMHDFFWNVLFFLRKFFHFFCELFHRKFSILFIAYTFECYMQI